MAKQSCAKCVDLFSQSKFYLVNTTSKYQCPTDINLADIREKLHCPKGLIARHIDCCDYSAATLFHNEISEKLVELCGDDDARSRKAGVQTILKLAGYSKLLSSVSSSLADAI